jgi:hypothetical protein
VTVKPFDAQPEPAAFFKPAKPEPAAFAKPSKPEPKT